VWNTSGENGHKGPCDTYGPEHLARLLGMTPALSSHNQSLNANQHAASLPELVAQTNMDHQSVNRLRDELIKFTSWFSKHTTRYFVSEYETPSAEYTDKARST